MIIDTDSFGGIAIDKKNFLLFDLSTEKMDIEPIEIAGSDLSTKKIFLPISEGDNNILLKQKVIELHQFKNSLTEVRRSLSSRSSLGNQLL